MLARIQKLGNSLGLRIPRGPCRLARHEDPLQIAEFALSDTEEKLGDFARNAFGIRPMSLELRLVGNCQHGEISHSPRICQRRFKRVRTILVPVVCKEHPAVALTELPKCSVRHAGEKTKLRKRGKIDLDRHEDIPKVETVEASTKMRQIALDVLICQQSAQIKTPPHRVVLD